MDRRRTVFLIVQTLFGMTLLFVWFRAVDVAAVGTILSEARWPLILLAAALALLSGAMRVLRLQILLRPIVHVPYLSLYQIGAAAALVNYLIPLRTGEATKSLLLKLRHRAPFAGTLPSVAIDRAFDLFAVLAVGAGSALLGVPLDDRLSLVILAGGLLLLGFVGFAGLAIRCRARVTAMLGCLLPKRLGESLREGIIAAGKAFVSSFSLVGQLRWGLAHMVLLSFAAIAADVFSLYLLFLSLGPSVPIMVIGAGFALLSLTYLVPGAPGYLGSAEVFGSLIFTRLGVGPELAATTVVLNHAVTSLIVISMGCIVLWYLGLRPDIVISSVLELGQRYPAQAQPMPKT